MWNIEGDAEDDDRDGEKDEGPGVLVPDVQEGLADGQVPLHCQRYGHVH